MTSITEIRLTQQQDLETFPNDGSLVAANKLAERDEDDYIQCGCPRNSGATRVFPTAAANNFLPHCETLLLRPGQNKARQPLQGD